MGILRDLNIVKGEQNLASTIFEDLLPSFMEVDYQTPNEYVEQYWNEYLAVRDNLIPNEQTRRGVNGKVFEYILATLLIREKIFPIFMNAKVAFVPNINYDVLLYSSDQGPICISAKTSFRERYKQADLEAIALKYVHRKSKSYLVTLSELDANMVNTKQKNGDVIGLDKAVYALDQNFNQLIEEIKEFSLGNAPTILVVESNQIVTEDIIRQNFPNY
jgi:hypothetical protein